MGAITGYPQQYPLPAEQSMAMLAHDLRTSMACVSGAAQLALAAAEQGRAAEAQLRQILLAVGTMDRLLERHCGEKREGGGFSPERLEEELRALLEGRAQEKRQQLVIDFSRLKGRVLRADDAALSRVLVNLAGNAVKYTGCGGRIVLRGTLCGDVKAPQLVFDVEDNGMGMRAAFLRRAFEPFARAREAEDMEGSGLGLAIARRLVQGMNGEIRVRSEWGKGSVFTVIVPLRAPHAGMTPDG